MSALRSDGFWQWSLVHYRQKGVEPALLQLQDDFDFNINIALWCCWCAELFKEAPDLVLRKAIDQTGAWNTNVTAPLRSVRRFLKEHHSPGPTDGNAFRAQIKDAELSAEKEEQSRLDALAFATLSPLDASTDPRSGARRNLAAYTALIGAAKKNRFTVSMLEKLVDDIFASLPRSQAHGE